MALGFSFMPGLNGEDDGNGPGRGGLQDRYQEAIKLLQLRLPRVFGGATLAPGALLNAQGGGPGMNSALQLQALMAMAGVPPSAGGPQFPRLIPGATDSGPQAVGGGQGGAFAPPPGPPLALGPMGAPGRQVDSHPGGEFGPRGPITPRRPRTVDSHPGGEFGPRGPINPPFRPPQVRREPPRPIPLPRVRPIGPKPPGAITIPNPRKSLPRVSGVASRSSRGYR